MVPTIAVIRLLLELVGLAAELVAAYKAVRWSCHRSRRHMTRTISCDRWYPEVPPETDTIQPADLLNANVPIIRA